MAQKIRGDPNDGHIFRQFESRLDDIIKRVRTVNCVFRVFNARVGLFLAGKHTKPTTKR